MATTTPAPTAASNPSARTAPQPTGFRFKDQTNPEAANYNYLADKYGESAAGNYLDTVGSTNGLRGQLYTEAGHGGANDLINYYGATGGGMGYALGGVSGNQFSMTMTPEQAAQWGWAADPRVKGRYMVDLPGANGGPAYTGTGATQQPPPSYAAPGEENAFFHPGDPNAGVVNSGVGGTTGSISEWIAQQAGQQAPATGPNPTAGAVNPTTGATAPQGAGAGAVSGAGGAVDQAIGQMLGHQPGTAPLDPNSSRTPDAPIGLNEDQSLNALQAGTNPVLGTITPDKTVAGQLDKLLTSGNPLLEAAKGRAMKQAAARGLVNSSIAAQSGEEAMVNTALPIAQQDASTAYNQGIANQDVQNLFIRDKYATSADMIKSYETYRQTNAMFDKDESLKRYLNDSTISSEEKRVALNNAAQLEQTRINSATSIQNNQLNADVSFANNKTNADVAYANNKLNADVAYANAAAANATSLANAATSANTQLATAALAAQTQAQIASSNNATSITNTNTQAQVNLYGIDKQSQVNLVANYNNNVASIMASPIAKEEKPNAVGYLSTWTGGDVNTNVTIDPPAGASTTSPINPTGVPQPPPIGGGIVNNGLPNPNENLGGG